MNDDRNGPGRLARLRRWAERQAGRCGPLHRRAGPACAVACEAAATAIAAYALSPIDPIPDFIPVLGYLDELILLPIAIALVIRMIPVRSWRSSARRRRDDPSARSAEWQRR